MRPMTDGTRLARAALIGDLLAIVLFLAVGVDRHNENLRERLLALIAIFVGSWLVTAWSVGTYRPPTYGGMLLTLVLAVPLAVLIRAVVVSAWSSTDILTFAGVALIFVMFFVGIARFVVMLVFGRRDAAS